MGILSDCVDAQSSLMPIDKNLVKGDFLKRSLRKDVIIRASSYEPEQPYYSCLNNVVKLKSGLYSMDGLTNPILFMFTDRNKPERIKNDGGFASVSFSAGFEMTKGDFVIVFVFLKSSSPDLHEKWLYTFDYQGNKIDSLLLCRNLYIKDGITTYEGYDAVSEISQDFTIKTSYIYWYENEKITENYGIVIDHHNGQRFDEVHTISSDGHFMITSRKIYESKVYEPVDLRFRDLKTSEHKKTWGIRQGKEQKIKEETFENVLSNSVSLYNGLGQIVRIKSVESIVVNELASYERIVENKYFDDIPWTGGQKEISFKFKKLELEGQGGKSFTLPKVLSLEELHTLYPTIKVDISLNQSINDAFEITDYKLENWDCYLRPYEDFQVRIFRHTAGGIIVSACDISEIFGGDHPTSDVVHTLGFRMTTTTEFGTFVFFDQKQSRKCFPLVQMFPND